MTADVLMVLGSASSVGKSAITAGLCRLLARRGARVAPFKAQNMSLNSAVTLDGGEIGRSTAVQAAAAGIEPTVDMNPILLKPEAARRAQVVVHGRVLGTRSASDYFERRLELWPKVTQSLDRLREEYDVVVAEGAGSPVELNLKSGDLVNCRVARYAGAAILLVGDIDRGGIFAQLIGTLDLLDADERALVAGTIVNRFRGDPGLFADGLRILEQRTSRPVFGVVPWVPDLGLADEDAGPLADDRLRRGAADPEARDRLRVAVVRLPHIANFDDFDALAREPAVSLAYVENPAELAGADLIVLPGSKSTIADLAWLHARGLADAIVSARAASTPVVGICGGYQMLGRALHDPDGIESTERSARGLGLLDHTTIFEAGKQTHRVQARIEATHGPLAGARGSEVAGYEIHMGRAHQPTSMEAPLRIVARGRAAADEPEGALSADGLVMGTHLHGLLDDASVRQAVLDWLGGRQSKAGLKGVFDGADDRPRPDPYDRWADVLEASLDLPRLLACCRLGRYA